MTEKEYKKRRDETLKKIPKEYREGAMNYAYMEGHSSGYNDILVTLWDVYEFIFNRPKK